MEETYRILNKYKEDMATLNRMLVPGVSDDTIHLVVKQSLELSDKLSAQLDALRESK